MGKYCHFEIQRFDAAFALLIFSCELLIVFGRLVHYKLQHMNKALVYSETISFMQQPMNGVETGVCQNNIMVAHSYSLIALF